MATPLPPPPVTSINESFAIAATTPNLWAGFGDTRLTDSGYTNNTNLHHRLAREPAACAGRSNNRSRPTSTSAVRASICPGRRPTKPKHCAGP
jgi:hypothetical protein